MIKTFINSEDLYKKEPRLRDYISRDLISFDNIINDSLDVLIQDFKNRGKKIRLLGTVLALSSSVSTEDKSERSRLIIELTKYVTDLVYIFEGSNDDVNFTYITSGTINEVSTLKVNISNFYKYYKLTVTGTSLYNSYLIEQSFDQAHIYKSLEQCFRSLQSRADSNWKDKAEQYQKMYEAEIDKLLFTYDEDEDGVIEEEDTNKNNSISISL